MVSANNTGETLWKRSDTGRYITWYNQLVVKGRFYQEICRSTKPMGKQRDITRSKPCSNEWDVYIYIWQAYDNVCEKDDLRWCKLVVTMGCDGKTHLHGGNQRGSLGFLSDSMVDSQVPCDWLPQVMSSNRWILHVESSLVPLAKIVVETTNLAWSDIPTAKVGFDMIWSYEDEEQSITGWWFQPLWKILVNWHDYSQYRGK